MADQNLSEFYARVARVEKARAKGYGFEAEGTLGRSFYNRRRSRRPALFGPLMIVLACGIGLKAAMYYQVGEKAYQDRVHRLMESDGFERLGGYLMQADPVTRYLSDRIALALN